MEGEDVSAPVTVIIQGTRTQLDQDSEGMVNFRTTIDDPLNPERACQARACSSQAETWSVWEDVGIQPVKLSDTVFSKFDTKITS